jgi:hypothetical protein
MPYLLIVDSVIDSLVRAQAINLLADRRAYFHRPSQWKRIIALALHFNNAQKIQ